jgi:large subunit ribosomal protein L18
VRRTNTRIIAQIINDGKKETLAYSSDLSLTKVEQGKNKSERAFLVGKDVGAKALAAGVKEVVFDRHGYLYHGRVQKLADGARAAGLIF